MLETFTEATFADKVGETFRVRLDPTRTIETQLVDVRAFVSDRPDAGPRPTKRTPFSLTFLGPGSPRLPQGTYPFEHDTLGEHHIFIVAIGTRDGGLLYEAVFN